MGPTVTRVADRKTSEQTPRGLRGPEGEHTRGCDPTEGSERGEEVGGGSGFRLARGEEDRGRLVHDNSEVGMCGPGKTPRVTVVPPRSSRFGGGPVGHRGQESSTTTTTTPPPLKDHRTPSQPLSTGASPVGVMQRGGQTRGRRNPCHYHPGWISRFTRPVQGRGRADTDRTGTEHLDGYGGDQGRRGSSDTPDL